jgi:4-nitrophenyl phosphatase
MPENLNLNDIQALIIDMDGVLWRGSEPLPGLTDFFDFLDQRSVPFTLATNNSTKTPHQYLEKLTSFGVTLEPHQILTSSLATAAYLKREHEPGTKAYIVGQEGLHQALQEAGFTVLENASQTADIVVAGAHFSLTYDNLKYATLLIRRGAQFFGTNGDLTFPTEEGLLPGAGSVLAAIEAATGVKPRVIGKPEPLMFDIAVERMGARPEQTAMVGDRLDTDILGGQRAGLKTILLTTGVDSKDSIHQKEIYPDATCGSLNELIQAWTRSE